MKKLRQAAKNVGSGRGYRRPRRPTARAQSRRKTLSEMTASSMNCAAAMTSRINFRDKSRRAAISIRAPVFVLPLKKAGKVIRLVWEGDETVEVEVGSNT